MTEARSASEASTLNIVFREACLSDAAEIVRLCAQWGYPMSEQRGQECLEAVLPSQDDALYVAECDNSKLAGWAHIQTRELISSQSFAEIVGIVVDESIRRKGVGKSLVEKCEAWAIAKRLPELWVKSNVIRPEAHAFYPGIGFKLAKTQHSYSKTLDQ